MAIIKVKTGGITADAITDALIADDVVGTEHLTANEVDTAALGADAVTGAQLADNAVNSEHYTDGSVDTAHIADAQITTAKLSTAVFTGATDIGAAIADADLFLMDDGAGGTIRKTAASRIKTYVGGGITMADQWRITASATDVGTDALDANWERADSYGLGQIGSAMTESSGVFTFPSTGYYYVTFQAKMYADNVNSRYNHVYIAATTDGTNYNTAAEGSIWFSNATDSASKYGSASTNIIFDVTNTSTHKLKFQRNTEVTIVTEGDTNRNLTFATFIRLGDT